MKIAQVSPLYESVPPKQYGGTERIVSYLTEALVAQGHHVTLFASGDSITAANLVAVRKVASRLDPTCIDPMAHHIIQLEKVVRMADQFDIIHWHVDYMHFPISRLLARPRLSTLHGRLDIAELQDLYDVFQDEPLVSISDSQRRPLPQANWVSTVHHGLPRDLYRLGEGKGGYLAFLGRISPEKRVDRAIEIAKAVRMPLRIAAKVDPHDEAYFEERIEPLLQNTDLVQFVGEVNDAEKQDFLGNAEAMLFPIDWEEPFGLVMIEAMACGCPVLAFRRGSVPEVMADQRSGIAVDTVEEAIARFAELQRLDRRACRAAFEERFTADRMAADYVRIYEELVARPGVVYPPYVAAGLAGA